MTRRLFIFVFLASGCQCGSAPVEKTSEAPPPPVKEVTWPALNGDPDKARQQILERIKKVENSVVIVHLDDQVLMDRLPRLQRIFTEVMYEAKRKPLMEKAMRSSDHGLKLRSPAAFLKYLDIKEEDPLHKLVQRRLKERLFSDAYLSDDEQRPGSSEYLTELHRSGAHLVYLSSLDFVRSGVGLVRALRVNGYPALGARAHLMMRYEESDPPAAASKAQEETITRLGPVAAIFSKDGKLLNETFPKAYGVCVLEPGTEAQEGCWSRWSPPPPAPRVEPNPGVDKEIRPLGPPSENPTPLDAGP
ncbi:MAG: hypothetical protein CMH55_04325 [Myxococcales bacterium]|nr:hypothetical protein [Myxococcales bacterium]|tara:strand:- start:9 stop:920 length:912 start_codon:yes stop_codon:yes gene_type:complete